MDSNMFHSNVKKHNADFFGGFSKISLIAWIITTKNSQSEIFQIENFYLIL
jgi:hypothetical protein